MNTNNTQRKAICLKANDGIGFELNLNELNNFFKDGWRVESTASERVAITKGEGYEPSVVRGNILVILVKP
ncbi:MAG: hypothetical protein NT034_04175 [Candidatus Magasanikbacteria bacterium]|nr:hypothetical protein [Candidatus Magasanikbacteria bacterium]